MLLFSCSGLSRGFDADPLFENVGFELLAGDRVGLVGPNGVGKTTLLRLLANLDRPDDGTIRLHAGARIALLRQQPDFAPGQTLFAEARTALDELLAANDDMIRTAEALATATDEDERKTLADRYDRLNELLSHHDAYHVEHQIEQVLDGLGFAREDYQRPVDSFSGGQQSRLMLAKLLLSAPDVMLLDEPSNHLDIDTTAWLEDYLVKQPEAMLIVSHDRFFLERVVTKIFELNDHQLNVYPGSFSQYWRLREERYEHQMKTWESQQEHINKQEEYIRRVHYGQLHKQAASRQKQLDKLERVEKPTRIESPKMSFQEVQRSGDIVIETEALNKSFDKPLFKNLEFRLPRGKRLGIMGPNGSGKTTLLRILLGEEPSDGGKVKHGHRVSFGYYDQHLQMLPHDKNVLHAVWPDEDYEAKEKPMRDLLARFGLVGNQVFQRVAELSGGEKSRAALAKLVADGFNVLVLDEPTNHLDLWACDSLEEALIGFEGTAIVVSHDRYFLNRVVDLLLVLDGEGHVDVIYGNYDTFLRMKEQKLEERKSNKERTPAKGKDEKSPPRRREPSKRKRQFPYRKVEEIEAEIAEVEATLQQLEISMASPELYEDGERVKSTTQAFAETKEQLRHLYEHWEEAVELN